MVAERAFLLGVPIDLCRAEELVAAVVAFARDGRSHLVANVNLHSLALARDDPVMSEYFRQASLSHIDGMPVVWMARLCGIPARAYHRHTYVDCSWPILSAAGEEGLRVFLLGGRPGVAERAAGRIRQRVRGLEIMTHHGYFEASADSAESVAVREAIAGFSPHLLVVGMGMPRQERWILDNRGRLPPCVAINTGAMMDYLAGEVPTPPRWVGRLGLEWLFRLAAEPKRLAARYLVEPWKLVAPLVRQASGRRGSWPGRGRRED